MPGKEIKNVPAFKALEVVKVSPSSLFVRVCARGTPPPGLPFQNIPQALVQGGGITDPEKLQCAVNTILSDKANKAMLASAKTIGYGPSEIEMFLSLSMQSSASVLFMSTGKMEEMVAAKVNAGVKAIVAAEVKAQLLAKTNKVANPRRTQVSKELVALSAAVATSAAAGGNKMFSINTIGEGTAYALATLLACRYGNTAEARGAWVMHFATVVAKLCFPRDVSGGDDDEQDTLDATRNKRIDSLIKYITEQCHRAVHKILNKAKNTIRESVRVSGFQRPSTSLRANDPNPGRDYLSKRCCHGEPYKNNETDAEPKEADRVLHDQLLNSGETFAKLATVRPCFFLSQLVHGWLPV